MDDTPSVRSFISPRPSRGSSGETQHGCGPLGDGHNPKQVHLLRNIEALQQVWKIRGANIYGYIPGIAFITLHTWSLLRFKTNLCDVAIFIFILHEETDT